MPISVLAWLIASTVSPSATAVTVSTMRLPTRSIRRPTPRQNSAPTSVATRLICANVTRLKSEVAKKRLGDEAETLRAPGQRADHRQRRHTKDDPPVVDALPRSRGRSGRWLPVWLIDGSDSDDATEPAVRDVEANRKLRRQALAVRDDDQDVPLARVEIEQHRRHGRRRGLIEVSGRLVAQHEARLPDERPRDRDPLLLAARQLAGPMIEPLTQPDLLEAGACARGVIASVLSVATSVGTSTFSSTVHCGSRQ